MIQRKIKMAKKIVSIIIVLIMMCALLISCGNDVPDPFESSETDINIGYDFIVKIGGEDFKAEYLNGKAEGSISVFNRYYKFLYVFQ